jgi:AcrR family transcriptional regulator
MLVFESKSDEFVTFVKKALRGATEYPLLQCGRCSAKVDCPMVTGLAAHGRASYQLSWLFADKPEDMTREGAIMTYMFTQYLEEQPRAARKVERTLHSITLATARLLSETHVHALSVNMVALSAGIGHGTVYRYFPGKSALVAHTLDRYFRFVGEKLTSQMRTSDAYERIYRANLCYTLCFRENVGLMRCHFHMKDQDDLIADIGQKANERLVERLVRRRMREEQQAAAGTDGSDIVPLARLAGTEDSEAQLAYLRLLTYALAGMADEVLLKTYGQHQNPLRDVADHPEAVARVITDIWWRSLYPGQG